MILTAIFSTALVSLVVACVWQHRKYLRLRRDRVEDRQPLVYPGRTFHTVLFLRIRDGQNVIGEVAKLRDVLEQQGGGFMVYAGQAGMNMVESAQISNDWDAVALVQYRCREAFDRFHKSEAWQQAAAPFAEIYTHGVVRGAALNLVLPLMLLVVRVVNFLRRRPPMLPYIPAGEDAMPPLKRMIKRVEALDQFRHVKEDAVVIFNLIKPGNAEQRKADRSYTQQMIGGMAEGSYGPMHMGRAVTVEGEAVFKTFAVVFYPGIDHFQAMVGSTFMNRIGGGKQLGDSLAVATIPILSKL